MSINNDIPQYWVRLKKEHPAIEITDESYERLKKALQDNGYIREWRLKDLSKPFVDSQMQIEISPYEAHDSIDNVSDGSTASYYELPDYASELQHLISHKNMNAQMERIFRSCYRYGIASHSDQLRDAKKIKFYIEAEIERLLEWSDE